MGNDGGWGDVEFTWLLEIRIENRDPRSENRDEQRARNKEQSPLR